ncbi:SurA N-terminal domain-containing protein [Candidatus Saccharibacteria bacterium]|nr:SurA N-terminal domain-containing protein [Candidatus Saccharibacteria bacterium]
MKKLLTKFRKKNVDTSSRITNETVAEHRERILAGGRRFKYPVQYARHRLVFNAIIISIVATIIIGLVGWWQLYLAQNTSAFVYRVTAVLPLPVANVDGQPVPYSDYLMQYRSAAHYLVQKEQISIKSEDGKRQMQYIKQQAMQSAVADAYANKLAQKLNLSISDGELESSLKLQRQSSDGEVSQQTQDAAVLGLYGWSPDEYRHVLKNALLRQKVAYAIDDSALKVAESVGSQLKVENSNLQVIADATNAAGANKVAYGTSGWVKRFNQDGGLALVASTLERGKTSGVVKSTKGDSYYFVRLLDSNDTQVSYEYIHIPLTTFTNEIEKLDKTGKVNRYISIPK